MNTLGHDLVYGLRVLAKKPLFTLVIVLSRVASWRDAQNAPTPYASLSLIYSGRLLADHPISRTRFRNIMNRLKR